MKLKYKFCYMKLYTEVVRTLPDTIRKVKAYISVTCERGKGITLVEPVRNGEYFLPMIPISLFNQYPIQETIIPQLVPNPNGNGSQILKPCDNSWFQKIDRKINDLSYRQGSEYDPGTGTNVVIVIVDELGSGQFFGFDGMPMVCYKAIRDISSGSELSRAYGSKYWEEYDFWAARPHCNWRKTQLDVDMPDEYIHITGLQHCLYGDGRNCTSAIHKLYGRRVGNNFYYKTELGTDLSSLGYTEMRKDQCIRLPFDYYYRSDRPSECEPDQICQSNNIHNYLGRFHEDHNNVYDLQPDTLTQDQKLTIIDSLIRCDKEHGYKLLSGLIDHGYLDGLENSVRTSVLDSYSLNLDFVSKYLAPLDSTDKIKLITHIETTDLPLAEDLLGSLNELTDDQLMDFLTSIADMDRLDKVRFILDKRNVPCKFMLWLLYTPPSVSNDMPLWSPRAEILEKYYTREEIRLEIKVPPPTGGAILFPIMYYKDRYHWFASFA